MTHVVVSNCQECKYTDCVLVCPVDCFYELEAQLVIDPDECIDCAACVAECPVEAIFSEDEVPQGQSSLIEFNAVSAARCKSNGDPPITDQKEPLPTAEKRREDLGFN